MAKAKKRVAAGAGKFPLHGDSEWFVHDRFGMFIHWGTYALPARHEWVKRNERRTNEDYEKYFHLFDPDLYDPTEWARAAKGAGMKYFVITTKHHEGFCLFDTKYTDYKATNTPYGKDLIRPMVEAFRAEGLRVGFYYSLLDWHHGDYPVDGCHPMWENEEFKKANANRDVRKYAAYMRNQVTELLTNYGRVDYLFFDFSFPGPNGKGRNDWESEKLMALCRTLQPHILIDDRLDLGDVPGGWDFITPEQRMENDWPRRDGRKVTWETCQTFSGSWGYHRDEASWKSVPQLLYLLIDSVSKGGNLLLNVGPTGRGAFDDRAMSALAGMGHWMKFHGRSIYGCTQAPPEELPTPPDSRLTYNPKTNRLYVHMLNWPIHQFALPGLHGKIRYIQLLNDASEIPFSQTETMAVAHPPVRQPPVDVPVLEIYLK